VAKNTIPNISKSLTKADNQLHSIIQGYMAYIWKKNKKKQQKKQTNYLHAFLLKNKD
jgi:hypothetical protein